MHFEVESALQEDIEVKRFIWGKFRKRFKNELQQQLNILHQNLDITAETRNLADENCQIELL